MSDTRKPYRDPTAEQAIGNIMREEREKQKRRGGVWRCKKTFVEFMREQLAKNDAPKEP